MAAKKSQFEQGREEGLREGLAQGRKEILDWLEERYTGKDAPHRGTQEADAILEVARQAGIYIRTKR